MSRKVVLLIAIEACLCFCPSLVFGQVDTAWVRPYNGPGNGEDRAAAIVVDGLGNVYVTGSSQGAGTLADYATAKYTSQGDTAWVRRYNGTANGDDQASALAVDASGNVVVTGSSWGGASGFDYLTVKYDPYGSRLWARRYDGPAGGEDRACAIEVDEYGRIYVTGKSSGDGTSDDYATVAYYPDGDTAWVSRYNGPGNGPDQASALVVDHLHNVCVSGFSWGGLSNLDYATVKYDSAGNQVWERIYNGSGNGEDRASDVAVDDSGYLYVTGYSIRSGSLRDYLTVKYSPQGDTVWIESYDGPAHDRDEARALTVDALGNVYVTGYSWDYASNFDCATIKYLPNGDTAWTRRYNGPASAEDFGQALVVDLFGRVYVTGSSQGGGTGRDFVTVGYHPSGDTLWVRRYTCQTEDDDQATAMAVDRWGDVCVTGYGCGSGTQTDYITIKYDSAHRVPCAGRSGRLVLSILLIVLAASLIHGRGRCRKQVERCP